MTIILTPSDVREVTEQLYDVFCPPDMFRDIIKIEQIGTTTHFTNKSGKKTWIDTVMFDSLTVIPTNKEVKVDEDE
ncbi:MAG: hypothetical protein Q7R95_11295 [bacterium]|nr:hypothetical protein [bacterium]